MGLLLESWWNLVFVAWFSICVFIIDWTRNKLKYFDKKNVVHVKYNLRAFFKAVMSGVNIDEGFDEMYRWFPQVRYAGYYSGWQPSYLIRDPQLVDEITETNFTKFHDRWQHCVIERDDPLVANLDSLSGEKWRELRHILNPVFTPNKMQWMFPLIQASANSFAQQLRKTNPDLEQDVEVKQLFSSYIFSTLASCGFGIGPESVKDPECEFKTMVKQFIDFNPLKIIIMLLKMTIPVVSPLLRIVPKQVEDYFVSLTRTEMNRRQKQGVQRTDLLQLLIQIKEKDTKIIEGNTSDESIPQPGPCSLEWSDAFLASQLLVFFKAGYETTSQVISIACYHLSKHPGIQDRVRRDLREVKKRHGILNYQALVEITLLDHCIFESLRLFPPTGVLIRVCNEDYLLDDGVVIEKGSNVAIPLLSLQRDSKYWSNPQTYDPDRFERDNIVSGTYLPFGQGPRACIGQRFALIQAKLVLAKLLENFYLRPSLKTSEPLKRGKWFDSNVPGGLWIRLEAIDLSTN